MNKSLRVSQTSKSATPHKRFDKWCGSTEVNMKIIQFTNLFIPLLGGS